MCGFSFVYDLRFPRIFSAVTNAISTLVNVDFVSFMPIGCLTETNFHHSLVGYTIGPLLIFALMLLAYHKSKGNDDRLANTIFGYFLALTFLILPSVSIKIFSTFACRNFDGDYGSFLKVDYSVDCGGDEHKFYEKYVLFMVLVYPIGIPFMYFVLLYRKRGMLDPGQEKFTFEAGSKTMGLKKAIEERDRLVRSDPDLASLSFLFSAYEPRCWWFEIVETLRRLVLTGGLLFFNPGTSGQIVASLFMCLGAMRIYAGYKPFVRQANDVIAETAQWQLFFTMFAALAMRANLDGESLQEVALFDAALVALQFAGVGVGIVQFLFVRSDVEEVRGEFERVNRGGSEAAGAQLQVISAGRGAVLGSETNITGSWVNFDNFEDPRTEKRRRAEERRAKWSESGL